MLHARSGCHFHHPFDGIFIFVILNLLKVSATMALTATFPFLPSVNQRIKTKIYISFVATKMQLSSQTSPQL